MMLHILNDTQVPSQQMTAPSQRPCLSDYDYVRRAVIYVSDNWRDQPGLDEIAAHVGLSPAHFQRLFKRWAGISPKAFLQAITLDNARRLLRDSATILDTAFDVGLSGPGRLHDLFVDHEAMTPGEYKARGAGLDIAYGFHESPFGRALIMATDRGICGLAFSDAEEADDEALEDMTRRWPEANFCSDPKRTAKLAKYVFTPAQWQETDPLKVTFIGTDFEIRVWETLLRIPMGQAVSYGDIAAHIGKPKASRAVGTAVGRNPISFVVPCHRVLRKGGGLGGYHWGVTRKRAIIGWEAAQVAAES